MARSTSPMPSGPRTLASTIDRPQVRVCLWAEEDDDTTVAWLIGECGAIRAVASVPVVGIELLRAKGNDAFQAKSYELAFALYTQAVAKNPMDHLIYGNRSAAASRLERYEQALADAEKAIELAPSWIKGYARKAAACEGLKSWTAAIAAHRTIVNLSSADSVDGRTARTRIQQLEKLQSDTRTNTNAPLPGGSSAVKRGFFYTTKAKSSSLGIYEDKQEIIQEVLDPATGEKRLEKDEERRWRYMLHRLKGGCNHSGVNARGEKVVLDDGVFAKLLDEKAFQALIFPGIPKEQLSHAPKNLQELLEDPWYEEELLQLMPKVERKAESVLTNVKKRGVAQGEIMDAATEALLLPQVLQEAFGREVLSMVHRVNYKKHVLLANDARTLADPTVDEATWDQLPEDFLDMLFSKTPWTESVVAGTATMDGFMGAEWADLLLGDAQRMARDGLLLEIASAVDIQTGTTGRETLLKPSGGRMRFVDRKDCESAFPALNELVEKLHALPFEINRKRPQAAQLCSQFAQCTAVHQLRKGDQQRLRIDCGAGEKDNGFKLTCIYFLNAETSHESHDDDCVLNLRTELELEARVQRVRPQSDRLVMFQSQRVFNEFTQLRHQDDIFYVTFWIHGKELN